jgi:uncharacterized protein (TIGR00251 family)
MRESSRPDSGLLRVRVTPRAAKNEVVGWEENGLRVRVTAAPVDGQANRAVLALLAEALGVPRSSVTLVKGKRGRDKLVRIRGWSIPALVSRLQTTDLADARKPSHSGPHVQARTIRAPALPAQSTRASRAGWPASRQGRTRRARTAAGGGSEGE